MNQTGCKESPAQVKFGDVVEEFIFLVFKFQKLENDVDYFQTVDENEKNILQEKLAGQESSEDERKDVLEIETPKKGCFEESKYEIHTVIEESNEDEGEDWNSNKKSHKDKEQIILSSIQSPLQTERNQEIMLSSSGCQENLPSCSGKKLFDRPLSLSTPKHQRNKEKFYIPPLNLSQHEIFNRSVSPRKTPHIDLSESDDHIKIESFEQIDSSLRLVGTPSSGVQTIQTPFVPDSGQKPLNKDRSSTKKTPPSIEQFVRETKENPDFCEAIIEFSPNLDEISKPSKQPNITITKNFCDDVEELETKKVSHYSLYKPPIKKAAPSILSKPPIKKPSRGLKGRSHQKEEVQVNTSRSLEKRKSLGRSIKSAREKTQKSPLRKTSLAHNSKPPKPLRLVKTPRRNTPLTNISSQSMINNQNKLKKLLFNRESYLKQYNLYPAPKNLTSSSMMVDRGLGLNSSRESCSSSQGHYSAREPRENRKMIPSCNLYSTSLKIPQGLLGLVSDSLWKKRSERGAKTARRDSKSDKSKSKGRSKDTRKPVKLPESYPSTSEMDRLRSLLSKIKHSTNNDRPKTERSAARASMASVSSLPIEDQIRKKKVKPSSLRKTKTPIRAVSGLKANERMPASELIEDSLDISSHEGHSNTHHSFEFRTPVIYPVGPPLKLPKKSKNRK